MKHLLTALLILTAGPVFAQCAGALSAWASFGTVCAGQSDTLHVTDLPGWAYSWAPAGAMSDYLSANPVVEPTTTTFTVVGTDPGGCTDTTSVTVNVQQLPIVQIIPDAPSYCAGDTATLTVTGASSYSVSPAPLSMSGGQFQFLVSAASSVVVTGVVGVCANTAQINLAADTVNVTATANATAYCPGNPVELSATGAVEYAWQAPLSIYSLSCATCATTGVSGLTPGVITFHLIGTGATGCTDTAYISLIVNPCDSVWPGDANSSLLVDNEDILEIGLGYGWTGPARAAPSIVFAPAYADAWAQALPTNGNNAKHGDCNGDGTIDNADTTAVSQNYGLAHLRGQHSPQAKITGLPSLYLDVPAFSYPAWPIALMFGDAASPAEDVYGISGKILVQGTTPNQSATIEFNEASWLSSGGNAIHFQKGISNSRTDFAIVRGSHTTASGFGPLAMVQFYPSNYTDTLVLVLSDIKVIDSNGLDLTGYNVLDDTVVLTAPESVAGVRGQAGSLSVYPNPTEYDPASLHIRLDHGAHTAITIVDALGRPVWRRGQYTPARDVQGVALPEGLAPGTYLIRVTTADGAVLPVVRWVRE